MENDVRQYIGLSEVLKALAHPVRLCIARGLLEKGECSVSHMQTCMNTPQSTVSQHLQKLRAAGIIEARRDGLTVYYRISSEKMKAMIRSVTEFKNN